MSTKPDPVAPSSPRPWRLGVSSAVIMAADGLRVAVCGDMVLDATDRRPHDAALIVSAVNAHAEREALLGECREVLHRIHSRAELAEANGTLLRGALGNIKDEAAALLSRLTPAGGGK